MKSPTKEMHDRDSDFEAVRRAIMGRKFTAAHSTRLRDLIRLATVPDPVDVRVAVGTCTCHYNPEGRTLKRGCPIHDRLSQAAELPPFNDWRHDADKHK